MNFEEYKAAIEEIEGGKQLRDSVYLHKDTLPHIDRTLREFIESIRKSHRIMPMEWDLIKLQRRDYKLSFLSYPEFYTYPYPPLAQSISINLEKRTLRKTSFKKSKNPPILHRRETFFVEPNPHKEEFSSFTRQGEALGLYENTNRIGFKENWIRAITKKGYQLDELGNIIPLAKAVITQPSTLVVEGEIARHKTAIARDKLSVPMLFLARHGFLDGSNSVMDYGCGRGDDAKELEAHGINVSAWDPNHKPDGEKSAADIVNLGFVLNVIEDSQERLEALQVAYELANKLLIVAVIVGNERVYEKFKPYKDGVLTSINTFQKYYSQGELRSYLDQNIDNTAIAIGPGLFIIFKDKLEEQNYFLNRQRTKRSWTKLSQRQRPEKTTISESKFEKYKQLFESFWRLCLELGRLPANDEFELSDEIRVVAGSHQKAFDVCEANYDSNYFESAFTARKNDLLVYFALSYFSKRPMYKRMPVGLQRDVKQFFANITDARQQGQTLLYKLAEPDAIAKSCLAAHEALPASVLNENHDLIFLSEYLTLCPPLLRTYIGCAMEMYGEADNAHLIKAHFYSGKVTFLCFEDFSIDEPLLVERTKVDLRNQRIDFFDYVAPEYPPQPLANKDDYIAAP